MSDDDYFVSNAVGHLVYDLDSDERYALLTQGQRTAALLWVLDSLIRGDGIEGWIESLGHRSDDALAALRAVGAGAHAAHLERAFALFPTRRLNDAEARLSAANSWTPDQVRSWRRAEDAYLTAVTTDDLIDNYVRPFIASHPHDFPPSVEDL